MQTSPNTEPPRDAEPCPILHAMDVIGSKWKVPILWRLVVEDGLHYNELKRRVHGVTNTMLTKCLRELEADGLIARRSLESVPPSVTYHLLEEGERLVPVLRQLSAWGEEHLKRRSAGRAARQSTQQTKEQPERQEETP